MSKYTVTPSIGVNIRSGPGTSYGKVGAYPMGTVVDVLEVQGRLWAGRIRAGCPWPIWRPWRALSGPQTTASPSRSISSPTGVKTGRAGTPTRTPTSPSMRPATRPRAPTPRPTGPIWTAPPGRMHLVSWHYTVDDHAIVQHLPDYETAYHAGDGKDGPGNTTSIGIEICVNAGGDFEAAKANAAALVRLLMEEHGIPLDNVVQHNRWNGKDCPKTIRATAGAWEAFLALCQGETANVSKLDTDVDTLANVGHYRPARLLESRELLQRHTVEALIGKTADYVREDD